MYNQGFIGVESRNPIAKANWDEKKNQIERLIDMAMQQQEFNMTHKVTNLLTSNSAPGQYYFLTSLIIYMLINI